MGRWIKPIKTMLCSTWWSGCTWFKTMHPSKVQALGQTVSYLSKTVTNHRVTLASPRVTFCQTTSTRPVRLSLEPLSMKVNSIIRYITFLTFFCCCGSVITFIFLQVSCFFFGSDQSWIPTDYSYYYYIPYGSNTESRH